MNKDSGLTGQNSTKISSQLERIVEKRKKSIAERKLDRKDANLNCKYENKGHTIRTGQRRGRNQPCPCTSGLKFKVCCKDK